MGRGDKKSKKGKRTIGSFGNSRKRSTIKARLKRKASKKPSVAVEADKPKVKRAPRKKEAAE
jgi:ribosomal small subunit protein bTHX